MFCDKLILTVHGSTLATGQAIAEVLEACLRLRGVPVTSSSRLRREIEQQQLNGGLQNAQPNLVASQYIDLKERRAASAKAEKVEAEDRALREDSRRKRIAVLSRALSAAERARQTNIATLQRSLWWQSRIFSQTLCMQEKFGRSGEWQVTLPSKPTDRYLPMKALYLIIE